MLLVHDAFVGTIMTLGERHPDKPVAQLLEAVRMAVDPGEGRGDRLQREARSVFWNVLQRRHHSEFEVALQVLC